MSYEGIGGVVCVMEIWLLFMVFGKEYFGMSRKWIFCLSVFDLGFLSD